MRLLLLILFLPLVSACDPFAGRGELLRTTIHDAEVYLVDDGSFDLTLKLNVKRGGKHEVAYVIDKSTYGILRMARYNNQILLLNDSFVFAAYDYPTNTIVSYYDLPFTIWEGQGTIVATHTFSSSPAQMRRNFPLRRASDAVPATTATMPK